MCYRRLAFACVVISALAAVVDAHPVPKDQHDRTITVHLHSQDAPAVVSGVLGFVAPSTWVKVRVDYRLEVDETTVYLNDMKDFRDIVNPLDFRGKALEYYAEFAKIYGPIYADRLVVRLNKATLTEFFRVKSHKEMLQDENGMNLGHLRCDFAFEDTFALAPVGETKFQIREQNYLFDDGLVIMSLLDRTGLPVELRRAPDDALRKRIEAKKASPDDERLAREITVVFAPIQWAKKLELKEEPSTVEAPNSESVPAIQNAPQTRNQKGADKPLFRLVLQSHYGFWVTLLLAFLFGAAHALQPGHGKTLVAAYLVGERGTIWHALYLGLVTTLTHTGVVIAIAIVINFSSLETQEALKGWIENGLGLVVGLIITGMGFWLFLQRVAGRADHVHLAGGHHHHHHDSQGHGGPEADRGLSWWGITVLGMAGGVIPCWDAIAVLGATIGLKETPLVLPAVLVFSAGLAAVLVAIGVLVVHVPRFVESRFGNGRLLRALPIISAILVTLMGIWMCYEGVHGQ